MVFDKLCNTRTNQECDKAFMAQQQNNRVENLLGDLRFEVLLITNGDITRTA